jgi:hypothetical protein
MSPSVSARIARCRPVYAARALDFSATYTHTGRFVNLKDLRDLLAANGQGPAPSAPYSQLYCGGGSLTACRQSLQASLHEALSVTPKQIYGQGACAEDPEASCFDMNRWVGASGISVPPFPFQNRPTFQQVVELTKTLPR